MKRPKTLSTKPTSAPAATRALPERELLDMEQAIQLLKTTRPTFYRWLRAGRIKGMKAGRQWRFYRDDVERFMKGEQPRIELTADIQPLLDSLLEKLAGLGVKKDLPTNGNPVARAIQLMIRLGLALRATDMHVEPQTDGRTTQVHVRYRVDGVLHPQATIDPRLLPAIIEQWKRMAALDVNEKTLPQDGRIILDVDRRRLDLRCSFVPAALGEAVTLRFLLELKDVQFELGRMDYAPRDQETLRRWLGAPWGLIFCTGPTNSGKTTTLYSCLHELAKPGVKVMSVEDPVEYLLPGVTQVQLNPKVGLTFGRAVRSFLRSDPDVILVGEIRDADTLNICMQAALTGHLVLTTLHTDDAAGALTRMVDIGVPPFLVADATKLIVAQRLVRRLCRDCSVPTTPTEAQTVQAYELAKRGGLDWPTLPRSFRQAVGCPKCGQTGYRGRTVIAEMLEVKPEIGAAVRRGALADELRTLAVKLGMTTMSADGLAKAARGETTLDEVLGVQPLPV